MDMDFEQQSSHTPDKDFVLVLVLDFLSSITRTRTTTRTMWVPHKAALCPYLFIRGSFPDEEFAAFWRVGRHGPKKTKIATARVRKPARSQEGGD